MKKNDANYFYSLSKILLWKILRLFFRIKFQTVFDAHSTMPPPFHARTLLFVFLLWQGSVFGQNVPATDIFLINCTPEVQNDDDECQRIAFPYAFQYSGNTTPAPSNFLATGFRIKLNITGDGFFDEEASQLLTTAYPATNLNTLLLFSNNAKTFDVIFFCQSTNGVQHNVEFGDCTSNPYFEAVVVAEPGELIEIDNVSAEIINLPGILDCDDNDYEAITTFDSDETLNTQSCPTPSNLAFEITGLPDNPVNPHQEIPLSLTITNTGNEILTISEVDFKIRLTDVYGNLIIVPEPNSFAAPVHEYQNGDEYYYFLNEFLGSTTLFPGGIIEVLAFSVSPPSGFNNTLGVAEVELLFARVNIEDGTCCQFDVSQQKGEVIFPGVLPCEAGTLDQMNIYLDDIDDTGELESCETGFRVVLENTGGTSIMVTEFLMELDLITSGGMMLNEIQNGALTNCFSNLICPTASNPQSCASCSMESVLFDFKDDDNPLVLASGESADLFSVIVGGLNGSLDNIIVQKLAAKLEGMEEACIPDAPIFGFGFELPLQNSCNFCDDISLEVGPLDENVELEMCEEGFTIYLNNPSTQFKKITVKFMLQEFGLVNITPSSFCSLNQCPSGNTQACVEPDGIYYVYEYCPPQFQAPVGLMIPLINITFSGFGGIQDIMFHSDTQIEIDNITSCSPQLILNEEIFPMEGDCIDGEVTFGGVIQTEIGAGVKIPLILDPYKSGIAIVNNGFGCPSNITPGENACENFVETNDCEAGYAITIDCPEISSLAISPKKDINPVNAVTTFDLVLITKHILNEKLLDSPYKWIAADANKSETITTLDLIQLRKLILLNNRKPPPLGVVMFL